MMSTHRARYRNEPESGDYRFISVPNARGDSPFLSKEDASHPFRVRFSKVTLPVVARKERAQPPATFLARLRRARAARSARRQAMQNTACAYQFTINCYLQIAR